MAIPTRRPYTGSDIINYQPVTSILTKNSLTLAYDGDGLLETVEISDGHVKKTMNITRNASDQITGVATVISEV
jgi:YD repeat-containing protein